MLTLFDVVEDVLYLSESELIIGAAGLVLSTLILMPELTDVTVPTGIAGNGVGVPNPSR